MSNFTNTPNLGLYVPTVGVDPDPDWANLTNINWGLLDEAVFSTGNLVPVSGLNINADVPWGATSGPWRVGTTAHPVKAVDFGTVTSLTDIQALYTIAGNLYWNNGSGTPIQITSGSSLNFSIAGAFVTSISGAPGLLGTNGAAVYDGGAKTFTFLSHYPYPAGTGTVYAGFVSGPLTIYDASTTNPTFAIGLKSPSGLVANLGFTLPSAFPTNANPAFATMSNSGVLAGSPLSPPLAPPGPISGINHQTLVVDTSGQISAVLAYQPIFFGGVVPTASITAFFAPGGSPLAGNATSILTSAVVMPFAGQCVGVILNVAGIPATDDTTTYFVWRNTATTTLAFAVASGGSTGSDFVHSFVFAQGDVLGISATAGASLTNSTATVRLALMIVYAF